MHRRIGQPGFTLVEILTVLAIILVLAGALLGVGKYLTVRAKADLTASELEVLATALQQYYDDMGAFPFVTEKDFDGDLIVDQYTEAHLEYDVNGNVLPDGSVDTLRADESEVLTDGPATSCAMFYFLDSNPNSRRILDAVMDSLISNKAMDGAALKLEKPPGSGNLIDLPRFIDAWGTSVRYEYVDGWAFPRLTSAGPDANINTAEDNIVCP